MKKINILKFFNQFINFAILGMAIGLYTFTVYVWSKTDEINTFILTLTSMGLFVTLTSIFSICWTGNSPCAFLLSKIFNMIILFTTFVLGLLLILDQDMFIEFINENMADSTLSIEELKRDFNHHYVTLTILYITYVFLMVIFLVYFSLLMFTLSILL